MFCILSGELPISFIKMKIKGDVSISLKKNMEFTLPSDFSTLSELGNIVLNLEEFSLTGNMYSYMEEEQACIPFCMI